MKPETWLIGMAGALALGFAGSSAQAAPAGGLGDLKSAAGQNSEVQDVHYGRRRHWRGYYYDDYPYRYRRHYGYGPGFYFHFGPRRHYRHHRHYYW